MPGSQREVNNATEEGVEFIWLSAPESVLYNSKNQVTGIRAVRINLGTPDATGRAKPEIAANSQFVLPADLIIQALGFDPENLPGLFNEPKLQITRWGTIKVNFSTLMSKMEGVFAAGDIVRGASLVVWAIRDGRDAASNIHQYISIQKLSAKNHTASAS
tara:strand:- start:45 stop:524 length:480 start_codon:yes stop_codon:yes gene_type:complete